MAMNNFSSKSSEDTPRTAATAKKLYEKPSVRYEQVFVTTALSCGKTSPTQKGCTGSSKS